MKKIIGLLLTICLVFQCFACTKNEVATTNEKTELIVFAAASMTETLNELKEVYESKNGNVTLVYNFDSSGTLLKQIEAGSECDVFISAAQKQMNQLSDDKLLIEDTRINLLENKVVLSVPDDNKADINSFDDLKTDKLNLLAIGNSDVPVGSYTIDILKYIGTSIEELETAGKITYGSNVKEVTTQVKEGSVDAGIIYATDANSAKLKIVDEATKNMCKQVIYPISVINTSKNVDFAKDFIEFLKTDEATKVFEKVGFSKA